ncbi:FecCD family ABC transporter permease [Zooshikella harenae]|uniref:Iron ABC transporter permease n=1 Tax=Zooshikella harenae TaxID=2827238 RepID=A0ABS5ZAP0_9GAMM|nr:iron ABC transporter permease [Zooshikella harenae]MBU2711124.1 iron ABC transporter permease [Zooshikella harenae]
MTQPDNALTHDTSNSYYPRLKRAGYGYFQLAQWSVIFSKRALYLYLLLWLVLLIAGVFTLTQGSVTISFHDFWLLCQGQGQSAQQLLMWEIRWPRLLAGVVTGVALAAAGTLLQQVTQNWLSSPEVLGVNEGATFLLLLGLLLSPVNMLGPWWLAPLGAVLVGVILAFLAGGIGGRGYQILLVGVALAYFTRAMNDLLISRATAQHASAVHSWTLGNLANSDYTELMPASLLLMICLVSAIGVVWHLRLFKLMESHVQSLGIAVRKVQFAALALALVMAGLGVGIGGPISFVAIAAPILVARWLPPQVLGLGNSCMLGATLVIVADTIGRVVLAPNEIPVGVITSLLGGPFLLWVLLQEKEVKH